MIINNVPIGIHHHFAQIQGISNQVEALFKNTNFYKLTGVLQMQSHTLGIIQNSIGSVMAAQQHALKPFFETHQVFHTQMSSQLHNVLKSMNLWSENNFLATMNAIPKIDPTIFNIFQNDSFKSVFEQIKEFQIDELAKEEQHYLLQADIEKSLGESDKKLLVDFLDVLQENMTGLKPIIDSFKAKNYQKTVIASIVFILVYIPMILTVLAYFSENVNYKVNRDNVRVRTTPSTQDKDNVITTLNRNVCIEKIDSDDKGWIKIRFELSDGRLEEGWIYKTMLSKIETG